MLLKSILLLAISVLIDVQSFRSASDCPFPRLDHGRLRIRQRAKLVKFMCNFRYTLVGNRYATCVDGRWDVPLPVCVRSGCSPISIDNGLGMLSHQGAWMVVFCFPGFELEGSSTLYCDGTSWNGTAPTCTATKAPVRTSCDFESEDLCGWQQDELHDFDWKRLNKRTPSNFLFTGPSYDHTYGAGGSGYYMYIESSSRLLNDTARLISPVYAASLANDGCFQFYYHMFGKDIGILRIYQLPESVPLINMLNSTYTERAKYILFEQSGNQGDKWYSAVSTLKDFSDSFQIVIEGVRGESFTSDIAIDDVSILQGDDCKQAAISASTPSTFLSETCSDRCDLTGPSETHPKLCGCSLQCVLEGNCCADFLELCVYNGTSSDDETTTVSSKNSGAPPQTDKLVASTNTTTESTTTSTFTTSTTTTTTPRPTTRTTRLTTRPTMTKLTTTSIRTIPTKRTTATAISTSSTKIFTTSTSTKTTTITTPKTRTTTKMPIVPTTSTTNKKLTTSKILNPTTSINKKTITTVKPYSTSTVSEYTASNEDKSKTIADTQDVKKNNKSKGMSSPLKTCLITLLVLACCAGAIWVVVVMRSSTGRASFALVRGRISGSDSEVRYLNSEVDD